MQIKTYVRQAIDDAEVVDNITGHVVLVRSFEAPIVLVEIVVSPLLAFHFLGHLVADLAHWDRFLHTQSVSQFLRFPSSLHF